MHGGRGGGGGGGGGGGKRGGEIYTSVDLSYNFHHDDDAHVECKGIKGSRWVYSSCVQTHTLGIHSRTVLSRDAEATRCPDGEKATDNMASYREVKAVKILRIECNRRRVEKSNEKGWGRCEYRKLKISCLVSDKSICSGLWFKMPYHQARIHGSSGCVCCMWVHIN